MKFSFKYLIAIVLLAVLFITTVQAQVTPTAIGSLTNIPTYVEGTGVSNFTSVVAVQQGAGVALQGAFKGSGASTANTTFYFYASADGTNMTTYPFDTLVVPQNGATTVRWGKSFSAATLAGYKWIGLGAISNAHASVIITNSAMLYSRPY